jgi:hypothetical protein
MKETKAQLLAKLEALSVGIATFYEKQEIDIEATKRAKVELSAYPDFVKVLDIKLKMLEQSQSLFNHHITDVL